MNEIIVVKGKKVGEFERETGTLIFHKKLSHLYKRLNSFCVNAEVLKLFSWKYILFVCENNTEYRISKIEFDKLFNILNMYISFGEERQVAIPIAMLDTINSETKRIERCGVPVKEFIEGKTCVSPYGNWKERISLKYYLGE